MRVFLTGGTGLLGSHLADELRGAGHSVVALCRGGAATAFLEEIGCELAIGDVQDPVATLAKAMTGSDAVVHGAGLVYTGGSWPAIRAVNVEGTRSVITAAAAAGAWPGAMYWGATMVTGMGG